MSDPRTEPRPAAPRSSLRREVLILLPVSLLLFVVLAIFTLLAYRAAVGEWQDSLRAGAMRWARELASAGAARSDADLPGLLRPLPEDTAVALVGARGEFISNRPRSAFAVPISRLEGANPSVTGPDAASGGAVIAEAPFRRADEAWLAHVEIAAPALAGQLSSLALLVPVVTVLSTAVALLVLLFLRHLLRPYEALLERARGVGATPGGGEDEVEFLIATFDRALAALARSPGDDLASIESALGRQIESGLLLLDREGNLLAANPAATSLLALDRLRLGEPPAAALAERPAFAELVERAVAARRPIPRAEVRFDTPAGARDLGVTIEPLAAGAEGPRGYLVLFGDLTEFERHAARDRFAESLAQLAELSAGLAHELRNSLSTVRGYLDLLGRSPLGPPAADYASEIRRETDHLARVVDDFLVFASPSSRRFEPLDFRAVVERAAKDPGLAAASIALDLPESPARVAGDPLLLERALRNLLRNAISASQGSPTDAASGIEVGMRREESTWVVEIADRGSGIPSELRARLFRPFVSGRSGGVGLGLALTQRIALLHGGEVELRDRAGGGTVARLVLPVAESAT